VERVIHALLKAEIAAKQARSINYQLGVAKMPLAKELTDLSFEGTPINGELIKQLASGAFLDDMRNIVLVGGTGTGKSHIAIGIARSIIRAGKKARFFNAVDLANKLEIEAKLDRQPVISVICHRSSSSFPNWNNTRSPPVCQTELGRALVVQAHAKPRQVSE
jgi:DNA replication protein DnaC